MSTDNCSLTKKVCRRKISLCSCRFNSVAKFHCQISVTKVIIFVVCERKLIAKVSVTNNLRQRKNTRGRQALSMYSIVMNADDLSCLLER